MNNHETQQPYTLLPERETPRRAVIDLAAIRHNYRFLEAQAKGARCIAVVKANAYGHGAAAVAQALLTEGCDHFAVSCTEEAISLRETAKTADILIFGSVSTEQVPLLIKHHITATVFSLPVAHRLSEAALAAGGRLSVHIKLDTGMNRLGFPIYDEITLKGSLAELDEVYALKGLAPTGIYSHLAEADGEDEAATRRQANRFLSAIDALSAKGVSLGLRHLCNSAGLLRFAEELRLDAVRLGIALYGYPPDNTDGDLLPAMRLEAEITHLHTLKTGERLGYGGTYTAKEDRSIATVGIGYADGWLRAYSGAEVTVHTKAGDVKAPVAGRICMDQCMLDVTGLPVKPGDRVTLFGETREELQSLAARASTIPYECLCLISSRVPRKTTGE